jgi:hypothetical protein
MQDSFMVVWIVLRNSGRCGSDFLRTKREVWVDYQSLMDVADDGSECCEVTEKLCSRYVDDPTVLCRMRFD